MFRSEEAASSSSGVLGFKADYCDRIADLVERKIAKTLACHLSETIRSAFEVATVKWSEHLQSSLHHIERELINERNMKRKLTPSLEPHGSSVEAPVSILRDEQEDHHFVATPACVFESELSSIKSRTPQSWCRPRTRRRQARCPSQATIEDLASLEQRLARDIFTAKLGTRRDAPTVISHSGVSDHSAEAGSVTGIGRSISFTSSICPSLDMVERTSSLEANDSENPRRSDLPCSATRSQRSCTSLRSMAALQANQWSQATSRFHQGDILDDDALHATPMRIFVKCLPRLLGVLPWNPRYKYSSMMYQALVALVSMLATTTIAMGLSEIADDDNERVLETWPCILLAVGGLMGLGACLLFNREIVFANTLLESYAARAYASATWDNQSFKDTCFVLVVFVMCMGLEYRGSWILSRIESNHAAVFFELLVLALCSQILRLCRCLSIVTDAYCSYVSECTDFEEAVEEWCLLHATCRSVCASIQCCFVVLQSVAIGALLLALVSPDIRMIPARLLLPHMIQGVLCAIVIVDLSVCASSFTHKCERVPMLVNSLSLGDLDANRMYLVEYIAKSKTGFYLFNLQLSSGMVLKTFYIACAAAFSLTSQALVAAPRTV